MTTKQKLKLARLLNQVDPEKGLSEHAAAKFQEVFDAIPRHFSEAITPFDARVRDVEAALNFLNSTIPDQLAAIDKETKRLAKRHSDDLPALEAALTTLIETRVSVVGSELSKLIASTDSEKRELAKTLKKISKDIEDLFWTRSLNGSNNVQAVLTVRNNGTVVATNVTGINYTTNLSVSANPDGTVNVSASGGGGTIYSDTLSGTINGVNKIFTTVNPISSALAGYLANSVYQPGVDFTVTGANQITYTTAPDISLSGQPHWLSHT